MKNYYDIDEILAEEELIPVATQFGFSHLAHLDPDRVASNSSSNKLQNYLPEGTHLHMPLWAIERWAALGFVHVSLPKAYARKSREQLMADPAQIDIRKRSPRFFLTGCRLVQVIFDHVQKQRKALSRGRELQKFDKLEQHIRQLRQVMVKLYTGVRLSHTLNWALSSAEDDVTAYTSQLSVMEERLFQSGAVPVRQHVQWKQMTARDLVQKATVLPAEENPSPVAKRMRVQ